MIKVDERPQPGQVLELLGFLEREADDLESARVIRAIELHQERCLVVAVRAPAPGDVHEDHLAAEPCVGVADEMPLHVRKTETKRLRGILHAREARRIGRLRKARRTRIVGSRRGVRPLAVGRYRIAGRDAAGLGIRRRLRAQCFLDDRQRSVRLRRHLEERRTCAGEVAQHERSILVCSGQRACVAVDAQDRRGYLSGRLAHDQLPRRFSLRALIRHAPDARDRRNALRARGRCGKPLRLKWIEPARSAIVASLETVVRVRRFELRRIVVELEREIPGRRGCTRSDNPKPCQAT